MSPLVVSPASLDQRRCADDVLIIDARFDLSDPGKGQREYIARHISGAACAHLDNDLSGLADMQLGRHPMPGIERFSAALSRWGWRPGLEVIVYDNAGGALAAARLWWLLWQAGHLRVSVLDGGLAAWQLEGLPLEVTTSVHQATHVDTNFDASAIVESDDVKTLLERRQILLIDARAAPRDRGEVEPIYPVAGHVRGAINRPFSENLSSDRRFKPADQLRKEFSVLIHGAPPSDVVHMGGSGVTACHNLLALEHAGLHGSRVYAPSWSGWIAGGGRPVATVA